MDTIKAEITNTDGLTPRQSQILAMMCEGMTDKAIANALGVTARAVEAQIDKMYEKNGLKWSQVNSRTTLIIKAISKGIVKITINSMIFAICLHIAINDNSFLRPRARIVNLIKTTRKNES